MSPYVPMYPSWMPSQMADRQAELAAYDADRAAFTAEMQRRFATGFWCDTTPKPPVKTPRNGLISRFIRWLI